MDERNFQKVYSVSGTLQGAVVQAALEQAGIVVALTPSSNGAYLDVLVPEEWVFDAKNLLHPGLYCGEIYLAPEPCVN